MAGPRRPELFKDLRDRWVSGHRPGRRGQPYLDTHRFPGTLRESSNEGRRRVQIVGKENGKRPGFRRQQRAEQQQKRQQAPGPVGHQRVLYERQSRSRLCPD